MDNDKWDTNEKTAYGLVISIVIILIIIGIILCVTLIPSNKEHFYNYCETCEGKTFGQCMNCVNCGFISKNGYGECVPGDSYGATNFDPDYIGARWDHNDQYWSSVINTNEISEPTTNVYGSIKNRYPYYRRWQNRNYVRNKELQNKYLDTQLEKDIGPHYRRIISDRGPTQQKNESGLPSYSRKTTFSLS